MTTEIIKGALAVVILAGAIFAAIMGNALATEFLVPLATFVFGYYFKQVEQPVAGRIKAAFGKQPE